MRLRALISFLIFVMNAQLPKRRSEASMTGDHEQRAREFIQAVQDTNLERIGDLVADDVRWWIPRSDAARRGVEVPLTGRSTVQSTIGDALGAFEELEQVPEFVTGGGDGFAAIVRVTGRMVGGRAYGP